MPIQVPDYQSHIEQEALKIHQIAKSIGFEIPHDQRMRYGNDVGENDEGFWEFIEVAGRQFNFYSETEFQKALKQATEFAMRLLAVPVLDRMHGWFSDSDFQQLMKEKGETSDYHTICNAANKVLRATRG